MPYANIKVTREGVTSDQKRRLISGTTQLLQEALGKDPNSTFVVIDEVDLDDWGVGALPVATHRPGLAEGKTRRG